VLAPAELALGTDSKFAGCPVDHVKIAATREQAMADFKARWSAAHLV
jgi:hypothetical protein